MVVPHDHSQQMSGRYYILVGQISNLFHISFAHWLNRYMLLMHKYLVKRQNPPNEVFQWESWSYQSSATATFKFSCNLVLLPVSDDEVRHTHSG